MLGFVEAFRQHNLSTTLRADVRAMRATAVTPRLNLAEHPKRSLPFSEFSVVMTCWTLEVHLLVYDLKVTLAQIVKRHNGNDHRAGTINLNIEKHAQVRLRVHRIVIRRFRVFSRRIGDTQFHGSGQWWVLH